MTAEQLFNEFLKLPEKEKAALLSMIRLWIDLHLPDLPTSDQDV